MQHGVPDHQIEGVVVVRDAFGVGDPAVDVQPQRLPVAGGDLDHAGRQVGDRPAPRDAGLDQVEQEKACAAAQFQGPVVGQLAQDLVGHDGVEAVPGVVDAALVVGDRPFFVVGLGFPVVVEHLGELAVVPRGFHLFGGGMRVGSRVSGDFRTPRHEGQPNAPAGSILERPVMASAKPTVETALMPALAAARACSRAVEKAARPRRGGVVHVVGGHHLVDQAQRQGLLGVDEAPAEHQLLGPARAGHAGQPGHSAAAGDPAGQDLGRAELHVVAADPPVGGQGQREAGAQGVAGDRGHGRLRDRRDGVDGLAADPGRGRRPPTGSVSAARACRRRRRRSRGRRTGSPRRRRRAAPVRRPRPRSRGRPGGSSRWWAVATAATWPGRHPASRR